MSRDSLLKTGAISENQVILVKLEATVTYFVNEQSNISPNWPQFF